MATMRGFVAERGRQALWLSWCEQRRGKELSKLCGIIMLMIFALKDDNAAVVGRQGAGVCHAARAAAAAADFS